MKNKSSIDEVKKAVEALEEVCERVGVNYAVFFSEQPIAITGGATVYHQKNMPFSSRLFLGVCRWNRCVFSERSCNDYHRSFIVVLACKLIFFFCVKEELYVVFYRFSAVSSGNIRDVSPGAGLCAWRDVGSVGDILLFFPALRSA